MPLSPSAQQTMPALSKDLSSKKNFTPAPLSLYLSVFIFGMGLTNCFSQSTTAYNYSGDGYVLVDPIFLRSYIGFTQFSIQHADKSPAKTASALDLRIEARIISAFMDEDKHIAVHDAFYLDLSMGARTSPSDPGLRTPESKVAIMTNFGYLGVAGYRNSAFGLMAGKLFQAEGCFLGEDEWPSRSLFLITSPWALRGEYRIPFFSREGRIILTAWSNFSKKNKETIGARLDIPIARKKRFWLSFQYNVSKEINTFSQFAVGIRRGTIY